MSWILGESARAGVDARRGAPPRRKGREMLEIEIVARAGARLVVWDSVELRCRLVVGLRGRKDDRWM